MSGFYRFPAMAMFREYDSKDQLEYIQGEAIEAFQQYARWKFAVQQDLSYGKVNGERIAYGLEIMDVIHAAETALRIEFSDDEISMMRDAVEAKNRRRGYY